MSEFNITVDIAAGIAKIKMLKRLFKEVWRERHEALSAIGKGYDLDNRFVMDFDGWDRTRRIFAPRIDRLKRLIKEAEG